MTRPSDRAQAAILRDMGIMPERADVPREEDIFGKVETVAQARERAEFDQKLLVNDIFAIFNGPSGRRVAQYLQKTFLERELFDSDSANMIRKVAEHDFVVRLLQTAQAGAANQMETDSDGR